MVNVLIKLLNNENFLRVKALEWFQIMEKRKESREVFGIDKVKENKNIDTNVVDDAGEKVHKCNLIEKDEINNSHNNYFQ